MYKATKKIIFFAVLSTLIATIIANDKFLSINLEEQIKNLRNLAEPAARCIMLYEDCNYSGASQEICSDISNFSAFSVSSIKIAANTVATLYTGISYSGQTLDLISNTGCLNGDYEFNDLTKSIKLRPTVGCAWMYTDCNYSGTEVEYCATSSYVGTTYNDKFSSALVGAGTSIQMFQDSGFAGQSYSITGDKDCFVSMGFNDQLSSLIITVSIPQQGCVWLYTDINFQGSKLDYCSDVSNMVSIGYNDVISSLKTGPNTYIVLYEDGNYTGNTFTSFDTSSLVIDNFNDKASSFKIYQTYTLKDKLEAAIQKYSPYYWLHSAEQYWPMNVDNMAITWPSDLSSGFATYDFYTGPFNKGRTPIYARILKNSDGGYNFVYVNIHDFNGCGPEFDFLAKLYLPVGSSGVDKSISVCPAGVHAGDFEHIIIKMNAQLAPVKLIYAHHDSQWEYEPSEVTWDGTHPVSYLAKGSHANYKGPGQQIYTKAWDESYGGNSQCADICEKQITVPYPCGMETCSSFPYVCTKWCDTTETVKYPCTTSCFNGFKTHGWLYDTTNQGSYWQPAVRLLSSNAHTISTVLSDNEQKIIIFKGRFGKDINDATDYITPFTNSITSVIGSLYPPAGDKVREGINKILGEFDGMPITGLADKSWWTTSE
jgi:hypothetical protein